MTCDICRGDSGPYRRCADPHQCLARLEGQRDTLEAEVERLRRKLDVANSMTPDTELAEARLEIERLRRVSDGIWMVWCEDIAGCRAWTPKEGDQ